MDAVAKKKHVEITMPHPKELLQWFRVSPEEARSFAEQLVAAAAEVEGKK